MKESALTPTTIISSSNPPKPPPEKQAGLMAEGFLVRVQVSAKRVFQFIRREIRRTAERDQFGFPARLSPRRAPAADLQWRRVWNECR